MNFRDIKEKLKNYCTALVQKAKKTFLNSYFYKASKLFSEIILGNLWLFYIFMFLGFIVLPLFLSIELIFGEIKQALSGALFVGILFTGFISAFGLIRGNIKSAIHNKTTINNMFYLSLIGSLIISISWFANQYRINGIYDVNGSIVNDSLSCLYFSIVTWTTLGYGDFRPSEASRMIAAAEAIVGYIYMAVVIAAVTSSIRKKS